MFISSAKREALEKEQKELFKIFELVKQGSIFEDFYGLFGSIQTNEILSGNTRVIDNITLDRSILIALDHKAEKKYEEINSDFLDFLKCSHEKIKAFNQRKNMAKKELSRAANILDKNDRLSCLVEAWFIAPDGSHIKILIMRQILRTFFGINPKGKTQESLVVERQNQKN